MYLYSCGAAGGFRDEGIMGEGALDGAAELEPGTGFGVRA